MELEKEDIECFLNKISKVYNILISLKMAYFEIKTYGLVRIRKLEDFYDINGDLNDKDPMQMITVIIKKGFFKSKLSLAKNKNNRFNIYISTEKRRVIELKNIEDINIALERGIEKYEEKLLLLGVKEHLVKKKIMNF
jgi:hypothetical protein